MVLQEGGQLILILTDFELLELDVRNQKYTRVLFPGWLQKKVEYVL